MSNSHCQVVTDWKTWASLWTCLLHPQVAWISVYAFVYVCIQATFHLFSNAESAVREFLLAWIHLVHWSLIAVIIAAFLRITSNPRPEASHYHHHCDEEGCRNRECVFKLSKQCLVMKSTCSLGTARVLQGSVNRIEHVQELFFSHMTALWNQMLEGSGTATTLLYVGTSAGARQPLHWSARFVLSVEWCKLTSLYATVHLWLNNIITFF